MPISGQIPRLICLFFALLASGPVAADEGQVTLHKPRSFGYFMGDLLTVDIAVTLAPGTILDQASIPQPGAVTYWLDLRDVTVSQTSDHLYHLALTYQTFYAPLEAQSLAIPAIPLTIRTKDHAETVTVPSWSFVAAPIRELRPATIALTADHPPHSPDRDGDRARVMTTAGLLIVTLAALAYHLNWLPIRRRHHPFAAAARHIRKQNNRDDNDNYLQALRHLHRAFDERAGRRLFADDLPDFLAQEPVFLPLKAEIASIFAASRRAFFEADCSSARRLLPPPDLLRLSRRLAGMERKAP